MSKALIVGAAGFVGSYLARELKNNHGMEVHATKLTHEQLEIPGVAIHDLNILNKDEIVALLYEVRPDYIFHLAAQSSVSVAWKNPGLTIDINVKGSVNLMDAVRELFYKPRVLLIGSGEEYGHIREGETPIKEDNYLRPGNIYAATKVCQNMIASIYTQAYDMQLMMVRAFNHIGPCQAPIFVISDFCKQVAEIEAGKKEPVMYVGNLAAKRDFTDVRDVVRAYALLVQKGTLRVGDAIAAGSAHGKVRAMMDDKGRRVKEAGPSMPVEILGLNDVPGAGDVLMSTENEKEARSYAETFIAESKNKLLEDTKSKLSLDDLFSQIKAGNVKELPLIIKADVQGSVEAVKQSLVKLSNEEVVVKVIHGGVGAINESDVSLASASNAIIIGFNVRPDATAKSIAEREKVDLRLYRVIYQAIEDVEAAMKGMLDPVFEEKVIGHAVVRQTFKASGVGTIAGAYVMDGKFQRGCSCRITRDGEQIFDGGLASLKRFKDDVKEVATGYECGLVFEKFNDIQEDDMVEAYMMVEVPR